MKEYELLYLIGASKKGDFATIDKDVHAIVTKHGGTWHDKKVTEERRLAYEIKHERNGLYVAQRFTLPDQDEREEQGIKENTNAIAEINRALTLHTGILRALIINAKELPPLLTKEEKDALRIKKQQERELREGKNVSSETINKQVDDALHITE